MFQSPIDYWIKINSPATLITYWSSKNDSIAELFRISFILIESDPIDLGQRDVEDALEDDVPHVHDERRSDADGNAHHYVGELNVHDSRCVSFWQTPQVRGSG